MSVLVDTSVWADHFRRPNPMLAELMVLDQVLTHPMVIGELACGTPPEPRLRTLADMELLLSANQATPAEVRGLIEREKLFGLGCGFVDLSLLASTLVTPGASLWTLDKRLSSLAGRFGVGFSAAVPSGVTTVRPVQPLDIEYLRAVEGTLTEWAGAADEEAYRGL